METRSCVFRRRTIRPGGVRLRERVPVGGGLKRGAKPAECERQVVALRWARQWFKDAERLQALYDVDGRVLGYEILCE